MSTGSLFKSHLTFNPVQFDEAAPCPLSSTVHFYISETFLERKKNAFQSLTLTTMTSEVVLC